MEPYHYLLEHPGKNIRTSLIEAFNQWMRVPEDKLAIIKDITEMLHNASLLIDDIEDDSMLRRGVPGAHSRWLPRLHSLTVCPQSRIAFTVSR